MTQAPVPVTMGSERFRSTDAGGFLFTRAWFPPGAVLQPHIHERATFAVMLDGSFDLHFTNGAIRRRDLACPPGTIFTEPAGEKHANYVSRGGASVLVLQPDPEDRELTAPLENVLDRINHFRHGHIVTSAQSLARELSSPGGLGSLAVEALALQMLVDAGRLTSSNRQRASSLPSWLQRAVEYVHAHFREKLRVADVSQVAGVHPAHLAAVFRDVHQMPLGTYIHGLKIEWVADQLVETSTDISTLAYQAGFADQSHLTRVFKRHTGWTPAAYRKARAG